MKRASGVKWNRKLTVFPRIRAGASLKPHQIAERRHQLQGFPPHSCGGLIEAIFRRGMAVRACLVFPRIRAGASLKHMPGAAFAL